MKRFLFLDIDGVMACNFRRRLKDKHVAFENTAVVLLNSLVETFPDLQIIITSTWRKGRTVQKLRNIFKLRGFTYYKNIIDVTPILEFENDKSMSVPRGCEIEMWLRTNNSIVDRYKYVILDDDGDMMLWQKDNFVKTKEIFTKEDLEKVTNMLL